MGFIDSRAESKEMIRWGTAGQRCGEFLRINVIRTIYAIKIFKRGEILFL